MTERTSPGTTRGGAGLAATDEALDKAFESLTKYDWGQDPLALSAIDDAVLTTGAGAAVRKGLELRLVSVLKADLTRVARSFVCRKLSKIGTKDSVRALSEMLTDADLSHMARYALERMPCPEAIKALRNALPKASGRVRIGIINSIGTRRNVESTSLLITLLGDSLTEVVAAAAAALGEIGTVQAANALLELQTKAPIGLRLAAADAGLVCAGRLRDAGLKGGALELYEVLRSPHLPDHIRYAANTGKQCTIGEG